MHFNNCSGWANSLMINWSTELVIAMQVIHKKRSLILNCIQKHLTVISNTLACLKLSEQISLSLIMIPKTMSIHFRFYKLIRVT